MQPLQTPNPRTPTYEQVRQDYPILERLEREADSYQKNTDPFFCANRAWYSRSPGGFSLKDDVVSVAEDAMNRYGVGPCVYDLVYQAIYQRLPDCRQCICFWREDRA